MIDRNHDLPVVRQCQILALARSTAYYTPKPTSTEDLALMRRMDELHLEFPFAGSRMLRDLLRNEGQPVGRKRIRRLMPGVNYLGRSASIILTGGSEACWV